MGRENQASSRPACWPCGLSRPLPRSGPFALRGEADAGKGLHGSVWPTGGGHSPTSCPASCGRVPPRHVWSVVWLWRDQVCVAWAVGPPGAWPWPEAMWVQAAAVGGVSPRGAHGAGLGAEVQRSRGRSRQSQGLRVPEVEIVPEVQME